MLTFTLQTQSQHGRTGPRIRVGSTDTLLPAGQSTVDFVMEDLNSLVVDFYSKTEQDTVIEHGCIVADTEFRISDMWCDGIKLEPWFRNSAVYRPRYFDGFLQHQPNAPTEIIAPYQFNFPGTITWSWTDQFWEWYFAQKNQLEVINFLDKDPDRVWKFRGSLDPCDDLVTNIKQALDKL
jgi:hypothetical protein